MHPAFRSKVESNFLSQHNDEDAVYLEAPGSFKASGERALQELASRSSFDPTGPLRDPGATTTSGKLRRVTVDQELFNDRKLPAMLMEQMIEYDSKLGRVPTAADRSRLTTDTRNLTPASPLSFKQKDNFDDQNDDH